MKGRNVLTEYAPIFGVVIFLIIIIFLVLVGDRLPNYGNWGTITTYLIDTLPYVFLLFLGFIVMVKAKGIFVIAGSGVIGIALALIVGQLSSLGLIDITKSILTIFGSIEALMAITIVASLIIGSIRSSIKKAW